MRLFIFTVATLGFVQYASAALKQFQVTIYNPKLDGSYSVCLTSDTCEYDCVVLTQELSADFAGCDDRLHLRIKDANAKKVADTLAYRGQAAYTCGAGPVGFDHSLYICNVPEPAPVITTTTATTTTTTTAAITTTTTTAAITTTTAAITTTTAAITTTTAAITTTTSPAATTTSATTTSTSITSTTTVPTSTPSCIPGSFGKNKGDGYKNYCCKNSNDCWDSCIARKCNGPSKPVTSSATSTTTRSSTTTTGTVPTSAPTCIAGSYGKNKGNGYKNYCCKNSNDCKESCIKGKCDGPVNSLASTTRSSTTTVPTPAPTCLSGSFGKGKGNGVKNSCCKNSDDCKESCIDGKCNAPR